MATAANFHTSVVSANDAQKKRRPRQNACSEGRESSSRSDTKQKGVSRDLVFETVVEHEPFALPPAVGLVAQPHPSPIAAEERQVRAQPPVVRPD